MHELGWGTRQKRQHELDMIVAHRQSRANDDAGANSFVGPDIEADMHLGRSIPERGADGPHQRNRGTTKKERRNNCLHVRSPDPAAKTDASMSDTIATAKLAAHFALQELFRSNADLALKRTCSANLGPLGSHAQALCLGSCDLNDTCRT